MKVWRGDSAPLGAVWKGTGVNFAIFSQNATAVELCLFDSAGMVETDRIPMRERNHEVWHAFLPEVRPGQLYGYRFHGPWDPAAGHRFNPAKVVLDPYAKAICGGDTGWKPEMFAHSLENENMRDSRDNAAVAPKSVVVDGTFAWDNDSLPCRPLHETIIYEVHVRGFSKLWEKISEPLRGTYAGLGSAEAIRYFQDLGVTAVELLPVHQFFSEDHLHRLGLTNYWGYNSIGFFAPHAAYAAWGQHGEQVSEFKQMVKSLHTAGIEVILDVVYNHTAEGGPQGPTLCFRGIDNSVYYRLQKDDLSRHVDYTGTGNTVNAPHPRVLQMIMDSLRYWVTEMHVDGFRFDLAPTLAREVKDVNRFSAFFNIILQDPVLSRVKLIAEPWDVGEGGYHVGNFPVLWCEWNDKFRDSSRRFWKALPGQVSDFMLRMEGSPDLYHINGKNPTASINFVTAHDGFTMADLTAYDVKHNKANGEQNRDGREHNLSWNCGVEGDTDDVEVLKLRRRQHRNFLVTLFLAQGVPMLCGGDEYARSQGGNNNPYCQDNEISWLQWELTAEQSVMFEFTGRLAAFRAGHPVFRRPAFLKDSSREKSLIWLDANAKPAIENDGREIRCIGLLLEGDAMEMTTHDGLPIVDDVFYVFFNGSANTQDFTLPGPGSWKLILDTAEESGWVDTVAAYEAGASLSCVERSARIYKRIGS